jgi:hypothetical protein
MLHKKHAPGKARMDPAQWTIPPVAFKESSLGSMFFTILTTSNPEEEWPFRMILGTPWLCANESLKRSVPCPCQLNERCCFCGAVKIMCREHEHDELQLLLSLMKV